VLDAHGFSAWFDNGLIPGDDFEPRIMAEIASAKVVVVLWCRMSVMSDWVAKEAREARRTRKFLPILIEYCSVPDEFAGADTIDLSEWDASPGDPLLYRLLEDIGRRTGRESLARISRLREVEEDWRSYGAPTLVRFALDVEGVAGRQPLLGPIPQSANGDTAEKWNAASRGDHDAQCAIAKRYLFGKGGLVKDEREGLRLLRLFADHGNSRALTDLGHHFLQSDDSFLGPSRDLTKAIEHFEQAGKLGNSDALYMLGLIYMNGSDHIAPREDSPRDHEKGLDLWRRAARLGNGFAKMDLEKLGLSW
jgi:TPR repeat protein